MVVVTGKRLRTNLLSKAAQRRNEGIFERWVADLDFGRRELRRAKGLRDADGSGFRVDDEEVEPVSESLDIKDLAPLACVSIEEGLGTRKIVSAQLQPLRTKAGT